MLKMIKRRNQKRRNAEIFKRKSDEQEKLEVEELIKKIKFEQECE